ncbi:ATP-dependent nuclease [Mycolicibacterium senegalense]|uniref:ATP-dependent nuclease n=1 Tax=Mycolicibacterium senegalense TaxID=1796 RepID=UPI003AAB5041
MPTLTLLALEEPENHLSPFFLSRVVTQLTELSAGPRTQAMLSSHSASALARVEPAQVRHVRLDPATRTSTVTAIELPENATEAGKYIREAVRAHPELYFARYVLLCEGDSEELVIPLLAQHRDVPIEKSFVAVVPLGGRHTNHFWRLLHSLHIPHATLLDLDWGRDGGGIGRIKDACEQLQANKIDPFAGIEGFDDIGDLAAVPNTDTDAISAWMDHLRTFRVYFSKPLDLDMALLQHYFTHYTSTLELGARGPKLDSDARKAVVGDNPEDIDYWKRDDVAPQLVWYRYLFLNKSKPATHLRVLSAMPDSALAEPPEYLIELIDDIKGELGLP